MIASANFSCCVSFIQLLSLCLQIDSKHWILSRCCLWSAKLKIWIQDFMVLAVLLVCLSG